MAGVQVVGVVDAVAAALRSAVLDGELSSGASVTEASVATRFEVARPSAKAAIEKLVADGLLVRSAHRSARVRSLDADAVLDVYATRRRIEEAALRELAASRAVPEAAADAQREIGEHLGGSSVDIVDPDMRFHSALVDAIGSERTSRAYAALVDEVRLCMVQVQGRRLVSVDAILAEHARILDHLAAGDADAAATELAGHLGRAGRRLADAMRA
ncbi:GntR family transcriptional regulator [Agromyces silvae]|uniref:GntR family transcriptional regulator n=1 Tax=Agromyces silvae TaxID=3388266 RepID=UPI00280B5D41|nr:GntR family transcriptional regulator [Agromyces protaetiae]